jgi:dihydrodipicolinate synthase/N-acetylneuraminate lyase
MISAGDLKGIMAMMPAFTTDRGNDIRETATIDTGRLEAGVDRIVKDGIDVITTTGSFGESSNLLASEFETLARATVEVVNTRVPVIIGCIGTHTREVVEKMRIAQEAKADGVIVGVPYYFPSSVENAVNFFRDIAELFPKLGILIYHNPTLHRITLPVAAFESIVKIKNVIGMKDSHRTPLALMQLMDIIDDKISVFVLQEQYYPYAGLGAAGLWSIDVWMGPEPLLHLKNTVAKGDIASAKQVLKDIALHRSYAEDLRWREVGHKLAIRHAGYCDPGPLRPPFVIVPDEMRERLQRRADYWRSLCAKYARVPA